MSNRSIHDPTRPLPSSDEMERGTLSCMMQAPEWAISKALALTRSEHFHSPALGTIFDLLQEFHRDGKPIDPITLQQALMDRRLMEHVGGPAVIAEIYTFAPSPVSVSTYAEAVRDKALLRKIIAVCAEGMASAFDHQDSVKELLGEVENKIMSIREREDTGAMTLSGKEALWRTIDALEAQTAGQTADGIPWGFPVLDARTGGICPGLIILGAETSGGKSVLAMQAAIALLRAGKSVDYYSLEMPADLCVRRMLCHMSRIHFKRIRNPIPPFDHGEMTDFQKAVKEFSGFAERLTICTDGGKTADGILSDVRQKMATRRIDALVVDYVQRLTPENPKANQEQQIADASRILKRIADQFNIPVITPVQLNDSGLVRGSRMLGMDGDTYIKIVHKKDREGDPVEPDEHGRRECGFWVEKNRNDERWFMVPALLDGAHMTFEEKHDEP